MEKIDRFNVRVYGLLIHQNAILVLEEYYVGEILYKFPGGGLDFGEGIIDCLKRELREELNLELKHAEHFYIQEEFVRSKFRENEQLLTLYYKVQVENINALTILEPSIQSLKWIPLSEIKPTHLNLPVDQTVIKLLLKDM